MTDPMLLDAQRTDDPDPGELIRMAGRREPPPADVARRVRSAVRERWACEVGRRRRRRLAAALAAAALLVLAAGLWLLRGVGPAGAIEAGRVASLQGAPRSWFVAADGSPTELRAGAVLAVGDRVRTGADGRIAVQLMGGTSLRIDRDTRIELASAGMVRLESGAVYIDSGPSAVGAIEVRTPLATVREIGTQFEVRATPEEIRVRVREGRASLESSGGRHEVAAGTQLRLNADGSVDRETVPARGPAWDWIKEVTPMPDLDGWSAGDFLAWVAREQGMRLEFADPTVARSARGTTVSGTLEGVPLDEALDTVLPACGLTYVTDDGTLRIDAAVRPGP